MRNSRLFLPGAPSYITRVKAALSLVVLEKKQDQQILDLCTVPSDCFLWYPCKVLTRDSQGKTHR